MNNKITLSGIKDSMIANNLVPSEPTHPGEVLREELECRGITQTRLAKEMGVKVSQLNELINGKRDFTLEYAMMIEAALGISSDFWMNFQQKNDKFRVQKDATFMERLANIRRIAAVL